MYFLTMILLPPSLPPFLSSFLSPSLSLHPSLPPPLPPPLPHPPPSQSCSATLKLLDLAEQLSSEDTQCLSSMLFSTGSYPDDNPFFVLCRSEPCSFTWTELEHIYQDIFECNICRLMGPPCCCTVCAYTCHCSHNCSFKHASPNVYCDCWEKCECRTLAVMDSAQQGMRMTLLKQINKYPFFP